MSENPVTYESVTLRTIDKAINDWFERTVDAHVERPDGQLFRVPAQMSAGERLVTSRERRGIRDKNGVLILPVISIRRTSMEPSPHMSALGIDTAVIQVAKRVQQKTNDLANLNVNRDPAFRTPSKPIVYEVTSIPFPRRSILTYELQVQAQFITQMNSIMEKMARELDLMNSFVAPFENDGQHPQLGVHFEERKKIDRGYVVGFLEAAANDQGNFEEFTDQERIIRWSTQITVPAVLSLDPEGEKPAVQKTTTAFGLSFGSERVKIVDDPDETDRIFGKG